MNLQELIEQELRRSIPETFDPVRLSERITEQLERIGYMRYDQALNIVIDRLITEKREQEGMIISQETAEDIFGC